MHMYTETCMYGKNTWRDIQQTISHDYFWRTGLVGKVWVGAFIRYLVNLCIISSDKFYFCN